MTDSPPNRMIDPALLTEMMATMSRALKLPDSFLENLLARDDDWSFVIKAHALLEASVCAWLAANLGRPELEDALTEIDMRTRVKLLSALDLGTASERRKMNALSNLRNRLAHRASESHFTFSSYLSDRNRRAEFFKNFGLETLEGEENLSLLVRISLWGFVSTVVITTLNERDRSLAEKLRQQFLVKNYELTRAILNEQPATDTAEGSVSKPTTLTETNSESKGEQ
jgi:hypothetical protein